MKLTAPTFESLNDYYKSYWKYLKEENILQALADQGESTQKWLTAISGKDETFAYAEGKWMLKEVVGHLCDTERILSYRALRFARNDKTLLSGFDENNFMLESNFRDRTLKDICQEWKSIREATLSLFSYMTDEIADRQGNANGVMVSPRIICFFILVHERHHCGIIRERYLKSAVTH